VDWLNRVVCLPKTKNNWAYAVPLNDTAHEIMERLYGERDVELASRYIFVQPAGSASWLVRARSSGGTLLLTGGRQNIVQRLCRRLPAATQIALPQDPY
jgi:hypothetical protein